MGFAAAPPPRTLVQIPNFYQHNPPNPQFLNAIIIATSKQQRQNVRPLSAYKRIPMEASGAYQLVNDATGDKVIVLGGTQDNDSGDDEVSQETLDWNTNNNNYNNSPKEPIVMGGSLPSFARLKAPQVKSLINKKKYSMTRNSSTISSISVQEASKIESFMNNEGDDEKVAAQEFDDMPVNPRASATNFRGWSAASVSENRNAHVVSRFKHQRKKMEADSGFFSRKSFGQLGCSDDMLEALRSLSFLQPSHIQVKQCLKSSSIFQSAQPSRFVCLCDALFDLVKFHDLATFFFYRLLGLCFASG